MKRKAHIRHRAFTVIELMAVIAAIAILAFLAIAMSVPTRVRSPRVMCQNNLKQIALAVRTWEGDFGDRFPMSVPTNVGGTMEWQAGSGMFKHFQVLSNELLTPKVLLCPADTRKAARNFEKLDNANLSFFVGLDADERFPNMILSGDRNLVTNGVVSGAGLTVITPKISPSWSSAIHNLAGNVGLADGSVQQAANSSLPELFWGTGTNVNRLAIP